MKEREKKMVRRKEMTERGQNSERWEEETLTEGTGQNKQQDNTNCAEEERLRAQEFQLSNLGLLDT